MKPALAFLAAALLAALPAAAQVASASLSGTVTDPTSGVIAGATVKITHEDTGFSRTAVTGPTGKYSFELLAPGAYTLNASSPGLAAYQAAGVVLEVNHRATHDIRLSVGGAQDRGVVLRTRERLFRNGPADRQP